MDKMLSVEEALGVLGILKEWLLYGQGEVTEVQRHGAGRLLSEITYTLEDEPVQLTEGLRRIK